MAAAPALATLRERPGAPRAAYKWLVGLLATRLVLRPEIERSGTTWRDPLSGAAHSATGEPDARDVRALLLLGFFEGTCETSRRRLRAARDDTLQALPGTRFACGGSGDCCRGYVFGPVTRAEKERIEAHAPRESMPQLDDGPLFVAIGPDHYRLATRGDRCVFLEGRRCGLHRAFGAEAKPRICRLYPLALLRTIDGVKVYDRAECATFARSSVAGAGAIEIAAAVGVAGEPLYHPVVHVHDGLRCDYGLVLALARRLDDEAAGGPPLLALQRVGRVARAFVRTLRDCPLEPGEPERAVEAALARPVAEVADVDPRVGLRNLAELCEALADRVAPAEPMSAAFRDAVRVGAAAATSPRPSPRAAAGLDELLRRSVRQQLFGRDLLLGDSLPAGLLRIALVAALTHASAGDLSASGLSRLHMVVKRTLHRSEPAKLLAANAAKAWSVLEALPLVAGGTAAT